MLSPSSGIDQLTVTFLAEEHPPAMGHCVIRWRSSSGAIRLWRTSGGDPFFYLLGLIQLTNYTKTEVVVTVTTSCEIRDNTA